jgi:hypothetical protein
MLIVFQLETEVIIRQVHNALETLYAAGWQAHD